MKYSISEHSWNTNRYCIHLTDDETKTPVLSGLSVVAAAMIQALLDDTPDPDVTLIAVKILEQCLARDAERFLKEDQAQGK